MPKVIPFAPMPFPVLKAIARPFVRFSVGTEKMFPGLKYKLQQSELGINTREYGAIMIFLVLFYTIFFGALVTLLLSKMTKDYLFLGAGVGLILGLLMFVQVVMYPEMLVRKKVRSVEKNLVFALRAILVQLKSGVSLFDSMTMVARGNYGKVSQEFRKAVDDMNTGTPEQEALEAMSERNPSPYLRKAIWQIVNGMNAGADVSNILGETVRSMIREQRLAINKYGSQLRVLSLMYMMVGVIMPALGVTLLIILFTFPMVGEAIGKSPALNDVGGIIQGVIPGESYAEGDYIGNLYGKQTYSGQALRIKVVSIEGKKGTFSLEGEDGEAIKTESVYGSGSNLRDYFTSSERRTLFGESLLIKGYGTNIFGKEQVEVTRFEPTHLIFWGLLGLVAVMQFMYIGIVKSRRPSIIG